MFQVYRACTLSSAIEDRSFAAGHPRRLAIRHSTSVLALSRLRVCVKFNTVIPFFFFLFGLVIGSFLNVCITRIPEGLSIVSPGSRCPRCLTPIKPYDNLPVLGWLILRGKCRNCGLAISPMYPIIEIATGLLFLLTYCEFGLTVTAFKWLFFTCLMLILIVTDILHRLLPDAITWTGFGIGLAFATRIPPPQSAVPDLLFLLHARQLPIPPSVLGVLDALLGAAVGAFFLWAAAALYKLVRKREGMGMGDVKMMALVGAFLGVRGAFLTILFGTLIGSIIGVLLIFSLYLAGWKGKLAERAHRRGMGKLNAIRWTLASQYHLPLGTFLGIAALFVVYGFRYVIGRVFI
jgi:leader peptidase (prepilin peptidase) / N-methyltransferase